jgi:prevent-host-death family protein
MATTPKKTRSLMTAGSISIADAKANLSSIIKRVEKKRTPVTILRRGVPVATITPVTPAKPVSLYGSMRGTVQELGDIVSPTGVEWVANDEYGNPYKDE